MTVAAAWGGGSKILSWIKSGPGGHTVGSRATAAYTVGLVEATLRLLLLPPHAVLQGVPAKARDEFKTKDSSISMVIGKNFRCEIYWYFSRLKL